MICGILVSIVAQITTYGTKRNVGLKWATFLQFVVALFYTLSLVMTTQMVGDVCVRLDASIFFGSFGGGGFFAGFVNSLTVAAFKALPFLVYFSVDKRCNVTLSFVFYFHHLLVCQIIPGWLCPSELVSKYSISIPQPHSRRTTLIMHVACWSIAPFM